MTKDEALKLALEAYIAAGVGNSTDFDMQRKAYDLAVQALAEQPQKPKKFDPNESFEREEAAQARVREFMRSH